MSWIAVAAGGGALLSVNSNRQQAKADEKYNMGQAEMTKYSPWTGMTGQLKQGTTEDFFGSALQGGVAGASFGKQFAKPTGGMEMGKGTQMAQNSNFDYNSLQQGQQPTMFGQQRSPWQMS